MGDSGEKREKEWGIVGEKGRESGGEWGRVGREWGESGDIGNNYRSLTIPVLALSQPGKAWWDLDRSGRIPGHSMLTHSTQSHHS